METFWSVARSEFHREAFAARWVEAAGFETFLPLTPTLHGGVMPMFHNYLFVNIDGRPWQAIDRTPGVAGLIKFGDAPARCPDAEIASLKARCGPDGVVRLPPPPTGRRRAYAKGEAVCVTAGPFVGLRGVHAGMSIQQRELVLMSVLGRETKVAIDAAFLRLAQ